MAIINTYGILCEICYVDLNIYEEETDKKQIKGIQNADYKLQYQEWSTYTVVFMHALL